MLKGLSVRLIPFKGKNVLQQNECLNESGINTEVYEFEILFDGIVLKRDLNWLFWSLTPEEMSNLEMLKFQFRSGGNGTKVILRVRDYIRGIDIIRKFGVTV